MTPYRVHVRTARGGWLETPRIFIPGYRGRVAGRPSLPERSPDGLVMLPVPSGESDVELSYEGTPILLASFWISLLAWGAALVCWPRRHWLENAIRAHLLSALTVEKPADLPVAACPAQDP